MQIAWTEIYQSTRKSGFWLPVLGLIVLYAGTGQDLSNTVWDSEQNGHGPFILLLSLGICLVKAPSIIALPNKPENLAGSICLLIGIIAFVLGRSQEILVLETGSLLWILAAIILLTKGYKGLKYLWVPIAFLVFVIPPPGWIMDGLTQPAKLYLSDLVVDWLFRLGFPIAQNGIVIFVGQYQLLVEDACVGLNSLYSLSAVGCFYIYISRPASKFQLAFLVLSILPIAFLANVIRVIALVLITYFFGEEAGQGFLHDLAGLVMFVSSLLLFLFLDSLFYTSRIALRNFRKATAS